MLRRRTAEALGCSKAARLICKWHEEQGPRRFIGDEVQIWAEIFCHICDHVHSVLIFCSRLKSQTGSRCKQQPEPQTAR